MAQPAARNRMPLPPTGNQLALDICARIATGNWRQHEHRAAGYLRCCFWNWAIMSARRCGIVAGALMIPLNSARGSWGIGKPPN